MRRIGNSLRSPAFLGTSFPNKATVPFPQSSDPNIFGWWSADRYVAQFPADSYLGYTVGNQSDRQVSKTERTAAGTTNLVPTSPGREPHISGNTQAGNLAAWSSRMDATAWSKTNVTANTATTITFSAQNAQALIQIPPGYHEQAQATLSVQIRNISGNTNLEIYRDGTWVPIVITSSLETYSITFTPSTTPLNAFSVGIRDPNAAGWGQIEIRNWHYRLTKWDSAYVDTSGASGNPILQASPANVPCFAYMSQSSWFQYSAGSNTMPLPATVYMTYYGYWSWPARLLSLGGGTYNLFVSHENATGQWSIYTNSGAKRVVTGNNWAANWTWAVVTFTITPSGNGTLRYNLGAETSGTLGAIANGGIYWGDDPSDSYYTYFKSTDLIWRSGVDSAATQEAYIRYLAQRIGLSL